MVEKIKLYEEQGKSTRRLQQAFDNILTQSSMVHIYFKELGIVKYSRDELYGTMDVIGNAEF